VSQKKKIYFPEKPAGNAVIQVLQHMTHIDKG